MKGVPIILQKETPEIRKLLIEILWPQGEVAFVSSDDDLNGIIEERGINLLLGISRVEKSLRLPYLPTYHPAVLRAIGYLKEHSSGSVTLQTLATYAHLSKFRLCHLFKQQTGKSAKPYLTFLRVRLAKELLEQERKSIAEVGQMVGFADQSRFAKAFSQAEAVSPSTYRERVGHKPLPVHAPRTGRGNRKKQESTRKKQESTRLLAAS